MTAAYYAHNSPHLQLLPLLVHQGCMCYTYCLDDTSVAICI